MNNQDLYKKIIEHSNENNTERKEIANKINNLNKEILNFITEHEISFNDCKKEEIKYTMLHLGNVSTLTTQISLLQTYNKNIGTVLLARAVLEECAIIFHLINEYDSSSNEVSEFYKYLLIKDIYQDMTIIGMWKSKDISYYNRFCYILNHYFYKNISCKNMEIPIYDCNRKNFTRKEIKKINDTLKMLKKDYDKSYKVSKIVQQTLNAINTIEDNENARNIIYPTLCHYTHFNITAIDELCLYKDDNNNIITFNNNCDDLLPSLRVIYFTLEYIFNIFKIFINDLFKNKNNNDKK